MIAPDNLYCRDSLLDQAVLCARAGVPLCATEPYAAGCEVVAAGQLRPSSLNDGLLEALIGNAAESLGTAYNVLQGDSYCRAKWLANATLVTDISTRNNITYTTTSSGGSLLLGKLFVPDLAGTCDAGSQAAAAARACAASAASASAAACLAVPSRCRWVPDSDVNDPLRCDLDLHAFTTGPGLLDPNDPWARAYQAAALGCAARTTQADCAAQGTVSVDKAVISTWSFTVTDSIDPAPSPPPPPPSPPPPSPGAATAAGPLALPLLALLSLLAAALSHATLL
ncbi:hypothetical protein HYH03_002494 [Edaphochlamys debaryana]|uniref:Uncharacterized protein n=1 Tax=Edaphochlamys debaryana TaxID=47281 RepID=A0A835YKV7_9CHLO|nr:hypothetical protein HYH03_002494 [Edaphochlamys debaryana]|eukprot:KAG2499549.1 hypothetical protein HYH03_002494 [Edaphochlamys debaryana]